MAVPISDVSFGSELFSLRQQKGVTQAEVATRAGLGRGYYSQLENSKRGPPSPKLLLHIAVALELDEDQTQRLMIIAVADWCVVACKRMEMSSSIAPLVKNVVQSAARITNEKVIRIEAILQED